MDRLRKGAPDLAELVAEERMSLAEARAAWDERERHRRIAYDSGARSLMALPNFVADVAAIIGGEEARRDDEPPLQVRELYLKQVTAALSLLEKYCREKGTIA